MLLVDLLRPSRASVRAGNDTRLMLWVKILSRNSLRPDLALSDAVARLPDPTRVVNRRAPRKAEIASARSNAAAIVGTDKIFLA